jgi:hypothetical protein
MAGGSYPGLSPQVLAFIGQIKQMQAAEAAEQRRHEATLRLQQEQLRLAGEESGWKRRMSERQLTSAEEERKRRIAEDKLQKAMALFGDYQRRRGEIMADPQAATNRRWLAQQITALVGGYRTILGGLGHGDMIPATDEDVSPEAVARIQPELPFPAAGTPEHKFLLAPAEAAALRARQTYVPGGVDIWAAPRLLKEVVRGLVGARSSSDTFMGGRTESPMPAYYRSYQETLSGAGAAGRSKEEAARAFALQWQRELPNVSEPWRSEIRQRLGLLGKQWGW